MFNLVRLQKSDPPVNMTATPNRQAPAKDGVLSPFSSAGGGKRGKAAVVGSGFGGLAAAIRLQAMGFETVCFEARDKPGGRAYVYEDDGFTFDAGPTVITAPHCIEELFDVAGRQMGDYVELMRVDPMYRLRWADGASFDYVSDEAGIIEQIKKFNPLDVAGYQRFADYSKRVFHKGYEELGAQPFLRFSDMIRVAPQLARLRADRSVYATVSRFLKDEHLRQAFSFHPLLVGGEPLPNERDLHVDSLDRTSVGRLFPSRGNGGLGERVGAALRRSRRRDAAQHAGPIDRSRDPRESGRASRDDRRDAARAIRFSRIERRCSSHVCQFVSRRP